MPSAPAGLSRTGDVSNWAWVTLKYLTFALALAGLDGVRRQGADEFFKAPPWRLQEGHERTLVLSAAQVDFQPKVPNAALGMNAGAHWSSQKN